jgi:hypothetical protein
VNKTAGRFAFGESLSYLIIGSSELGCQGGGVCLYEFSLESRNLLEKGIVEMYDIGVGTVIDAKGLETDGTSAKLLVDTVEQSPIA